MNWSPLQIREIFHLEFLRELAVKIPSSSFILKGGSNLRFFFGSNRYSEDMDLDAEGLPVDALCEKVMAILRSKTLANRLRTFGIGKIIPLNLVSAKQTETVQRFKIHLLTAAEEDLFTKVEFSRRGLDSPAAPETVDASVTARYLIPPLIVPHYLAEAAIKQKIRALVSRKDTKGYARIRKVMQGYERLRSDNRINRESRELTRMKTEDSFGSAAT